MRPDEFTSLLGTCDRLAEGGADLVEMVLADEARRGTIHRRAVVDDRPVASHRTRTLTRQRRCGASPTMRANRTWSLAARTSAGGCSSAAQSEFRPTGAAEFVGFAQYWEDRLAARNSCALCPLTCGFLGQRQPTFHRL